MKKRILVCCSFFAVVLLHSCATIFSGTKAKVTVNSPNASWANIKVDGEEYDSIVFPAQIKVKRGHNPSVVEAENPEMEGSATIEKKFNPVSLGNLGFILFGGVFGSPSFIIDAADGAISKPEKTEYTILMSPKKNRGVNDKDSNEHLPKDEPSK